MPKKSIRFKRLLEELDIPQEEWDVLEDALLDAIDRYAHIVHPGHEDYVHLPLGEFLSNPYLLGYGALEVIRHPALSLRTRLQFVQHVLRQGRPLEEDGIPHGLPAMLSFLAGVRLLEVAAFESLMQIADIDNRWFEDWPAREAVVLLDWLIAQADVPDEERVWWLWYILAQCEPVDEGRALVDNIMAHPALTLKLKREICHAWIEGKQPGHPPARWRAVKASLRGDEDATREALAELDPAELAELESLDEEVEDFEPSFAFIRSLMRDDQVSVPSYLKGHAVRVLGDLSDDPLAVCRKYLERGYYADAVNLAIAAVLRRHRERIPDDGLRELIDNALTIGKVGTRKAFYQLGVEFFGQEYLKRALQDNANSIRTWAAQGAPREPEKAGLKKRGDRRVARAD